MAAVIHQRDRNGSLAHPFAAQNASHERGKIVTRDRDEALRVGDLDHDPVRGRLSLRRLVLSVWCGIGLGIRECRSGGLLFRILDPTVVDAGERLDQAVANFGDFFERQAALVELGVAQPLVDQVADEAFDTRRRRLRERSAALSTESAIRMAASLVCGLGPGYRKALSGTVGVGIAAVPAIRLMKEVLDVPWSWSIRSMMVRAGGAGDPSQFRP